MERNPDENGWQSSSAAWIASQAGPGDYTRAHVLDPVMLRLARRSAAMDVLDIGCGEGRFCRMLADSGMRVTGLDPAPALVAEARRLHPEGTYVEGFAETLPFADRTFDLAVHYLTLIDIDGLDAALAETARVMRPGALLLIANLTGFTTSNGTGGWIEDAAGNSHFPLGSYLTETRDWVEWDGIRVRNWHRPLSRYMDACLKAGLLLTDFEEPEPQGGPAEIAARYRLAPWAMAMAWRKP
jgi:SAM-dependent methyltransferase